MSTRYKADDPAGIYFVTFTVIDWLDVFIREAYCNILLDSIKYCQMHKGLILHAWCIMPSHVHLIASTTNSTGNLTSIIGDLKKFTSREIISAIRNNIQESRRDWLLPHFEKAGWRDTNKFWQYGNHPIGLFSIPVIRQKLDYIHKNPVEMGFIDEPWHYRYSSARDYAGTKGLLELEMLI